MDLPLRALPTHEDIIGMAQSHASECINTLVDVMHTGNNNAKIAAANSLLDRGFGKVGQPIEFTGADGGHVAVSLGISKAVADALSVLHGVQGYAEARRHGHVS
ncbi:MAG: hypothetical protein LBD42_04645 [Desulfovibrio sp.]|jgi:hypothetical protein|nr:hypothetical protein [Desulfovibrio sp.]